MILLMRVRVRAKFLGLIKTSILINFFLVYPLKPLEH